MTVGIGCASIVQVRKVYDVEQLTTNQSPAIQCPECQRHGRVCYLRFHHISLHESVQKCAQPTCMYPFTGFRYRDTSDPLQRVYRYERVAPNRPLTPAPSPKCVDDGDGDADADGAVRRRVEDVADASPEVPQLSDDDDRLLDGCADDSIDEFNLTWLDEMAAQAATESGLADDDDSLQGMHDTTSLDNSVQNCLALADDCSFMNELNIDEILKDICNSARHADDEQSVADSDRMESIDSCETVWVESVVLPPPPTTTTTPLVVEAPPVKPTAMLSKCFAQFGGLPTRKRKATSGTRRARKSAAATAAPSLNFNFINQPIKPPQPTTETDDESSRSSSSIVTSRPPSPADSVASNSSRGRLSHCDVNEKLQHIIANKDTLRPLELINSLTKLNFSALRSTSAAASTALRPAAQKAVRKASVRAPRKEQFKLNFVNRSEASVPNDTTGSVDLQMAEAPAISYVVQVLPFDGIKYELSVSAQTTPFNWPPPAQADDSMLTETPIECVAVEKDAQVVEDSNQICRSMESCVIVNVTQVPESVTNSTLTLPPIECGPVEADSDQISRSMESCDIESVAQGPDSAFHSTLILPSIDCGPVEADNVIEADTHSTPILPPIECGPVEADNVIEADSNQTDRSMQNGDNVSVAQAPVRYTDAAGGLDDVAVPTPTDVEDLERDFLGFTRRETLYSRGKIRQLDQAMRSFEDDKPKRRKY